MTQTKTLSLVTTVTRTKTDKTGGQGCGNSTVLKVGRFDESTDHIYRSFLRLVPDWTEVGRIVSADMVLYTKVAGAGVVYIRGLASIFVDGNNVDGTWDATDYTNPNSVTSGAKTVTMAKTVNGATRIDVTAWMNGLAPKTVMMSNGKPGTASPNRGWALDAYGSTFGTQWQGYSNDQPDTSKLPVIELVYEPAKTIPNVPTNLTPAGAVESFDYFEGDFSDSKGTDTLAASAVQVFDASHSATAGTNDIITSVAHGQNNGDSIWIIDGNGIGLYGHTKYYVRDRTADTFKVSLTSGGAAANVTTAYTTLTWRRLLWDSGFQRESASAILAGRSQLEPVNRRVVVSSRDNDVQSGGDLRLKAGTTYGWRLQHKDQEDQVSPWTAIVTFSVTNTDPAAPIPTPTLVSLPTLNAVKFRGGTFHDADVGDHLQSFQIQFSAHADFDVSDPNNILWDTGRVVSPFGATSWEAQYGGPSINAGDYYWRARQWDQRGGVSAWSATATITLTEDFDEQPGNQPLIRLDKRAPWRLVFKAMHTNGLRGPGAIIGLIDDAKSIGASQMYNSPGELHFTLPVDHPQISIIEPKQVHYSLQIRDGEGWREKFAGLIWDMDATETTVIFYGLDYLALFDYDYDERFNGDPDTDYTKGGSKYTNKTVREIVLNQLTQAVAVANSPVRFITVGAIATMDEKVTVYSTYEPRLKFITGMLNSHRQGTGKQTQIKVRPKTGGGYEVVVVEIDLERAPKEHLRMRYGELVNGYRIIPFGTSWASRTAAIGRTRSGLKVFYKVASAPGIDQSIWGRITQTRVFDGIADENDLIRQLKQAALHSGKLGGQVALGIRSGVISPFDGYDLCDAIPVKINHGAVNTDNYGSGYWVIFGVAWEVGDDGSQSTIMTLQPREDLTEPDLDLIPSREISTQTEWQVGWTPPPPTATSKYWLDQTTGIVYIRDSSGPGTDITGTASTDTLHALAHPFSLDDPVRFNNLTGGAGLDNTVTYYVIADGLTANDFKISLTVGGAAFDFTTDVTAGIVDPLSTYVPVDDGTMTPPDPPPAPTFVNVIPIGRIDTDGSFSSGVTVTWTNNGGAMRRGTRVLVSTAETAPGVPDYSAAQSIMVGPDETSTTITGLPSGAPMYVKVSAVSVFGNESDEVEATPTVAAVDDVAPPMPNEVVATPGVLGFLASWVSTTARDLAFYEFRYAPDDGTGTGPDTAQWTNARAKTNFVWVGHLLAQKYWMQVRAVDATGNVVTSVTDATPVPYTQDDEAGMTAAVAVTPTLTQGADIEEGSIATSHIAAAGIDAGVIRAGYLRLSVGDATAIDGVQVFDGENLVGFWNETGLYVYSSADSNDYVRLYDGGISVFLDGVEVAALSPAGVNASAITSGALPGGGNIVKNSSFELADFSTPVTVTSTWTAAADWNASRSGSDTNITTGAGALTETAVTY